MLLKKAHKPELMDDFTIQDERIDTALRELRLINYFLGGNNGSKRGITKLVSGIQDRKIYLLDAGAGSSDVLDDLKKKHKNVQVISLDKNRRVCNFIRKNSNLKPVVVCADAFNLPFKEKSVDIVHASLFLHHFENKSLLRLLLGFNLVSKRGLVINDLRRSLRAYLGIKILISLFSQSDLVKNDAPMSVRKGFSKTELIDLLMKAKLQKFEISRKWAFRWIVTVNF
jgi:hypothetical protein